MNLDQPAPSVSGIQLDPHQLLDPDHVALAAELFTMLADPTRIRIVALLAMGEMSAGDLAAAVGKSAAAVSQHLAKLRLARLVTTRREGTRIHYSLVTEHPAELVIHAIAQAQHHSDDNPAHHNRH